jgi:uroporphyrinogen-III synthase
MRRVVVLRPQPGASATVDAARERGLDAIAISLFEIEPVAWEAPEASGFDGLLLTSANALRCAGDQLQGVRGLPVYAVGAATGQAARDAGFDVASIGDAGVDRLLGSIEPDLKLLHLTGEDRKTAEGPRQDITVVTVYRALPAERVDVREAEEAVVLIHSPRAGRRFAELADGAGVDKGSIAIAAISAEAAEAAGGGWAEVATAEAPTDQALLALAERLCNNLAPR